VIAEYDDILDDLFHGCALRAYLEVMAETGQWPPDSEATRQRAYRYYEQALAEKNRRKTRSDQVAAGLAGGDGRQEMESGPGQIEQGEG
jgi:hypothetical protein